MIRQRLKILFVVAACMNIASCGFLKRTFNKKKKQPGVTVEIAPAIIDSAKVTGEVPVVPLNNEKQKLINSILPYWKTKSEFNTLSAKIKMHYEGKGDKQDFTASVRIQKDEVIWMQVTATFLNVQVARIYITPDSFKLINYLERTALVMPIANAQKILPIPVDFQVLQNLFLGRPLQNEGNAIDALNLGTTVSLQTATNEIIQLLTFNKIDSSLNSLQLSSTNDSGLSGTMQYSRYEKTGSRNFSMDRIFNAQNAGEKYLLEMDFTHAAFDETLEFPFSIPKNYEIK